MNVKIVHQYKITILLDKESDNYEYYRR